MIAKGRETSRLDAGPRWTGGWRARHFAAGDVHVADLLRLCVLAVGPRPDARLRHAEQGLSRLDRAWPSRGRQGGRARGSSSGATFHPGWWVFVPNNSCSVALCFRPRPRMRMRTALAAALFTGRAKTPPGPRDLAGRRHQRSAPTAGGGSQERKDARLLRPRCRHQPDQGQEGRHRRLWLPGPCPCAQPARFRREERRGRPSRARPRPRRRKARPQGHERRRGRQVGRRDDDAHARRAAGGHLPRRSRRQHEAGRGAACSPMASTCIST